ncbi:MAG: hypothetical protein AMJ77_04830 [Dehalococcoidia bacterium SM23_28_2]|nr:MAG: hypothetical protein AMJ77_04830 [Dehalococcoidia bacterium SM23_28_2]
MSRLLCVVLAALVALALALGCGDDGELSIQDYLQDIHALMEESAANAEELGDPFAYQELATDEELLRAIRDYCDALVPMVRRSINTLSDMEPPPEAVEPHNELLASVGSLADAFEDLGEQAADAQSLEELNQWTIESGWNETYASSGEGANRACLALQDLADENSVALDFECIEDEGA